MKPYRSDGEACSPFASAELVRRNSCLLLCGSAGMERSRSRAIGIKASFGLLSHHNLRGQPRSLNVEEFHKFIHNLDEPFRTMALVCVCFGLRISECLALRWSDIDWLEARLRAWNVASSEGA